MIQSAKRRARGFRTFEGYAYMIYLVAGKLNLFCPKEQKTELMRFCGCGKPFMHSGQKPSTIFHTAFSKVLNERALLSNFNRGLFVFVKKVFIKITR